jgi:hypothetical protein
LRALTGTILAAMLLPASSASAGGNPEIAVTPSSIDFPDQYVGDTTPSETVTVQNVAPNSPPLQVQQPTISGAALNDFAIVSDGCAPYPRDLIDQAQPGSSCTFGVEFTPTAPSFRAATLNIPSNDFDEPNTTVPLTGDGVEAPLADLLVGKAGGMLIGDDVYEPTPVTQILTGKIKRGRAKDYVVSVGNDANLIGITVQGCASSHGFKVTYSHQGADVTDDVVAGTYLSEVATSNPDPLDVRVKAKHSAHGTLVCTVTGSAEGSDDDAVQLKLQRKR